MTPFLVISPARHPLPPFCTAHPFSLVIVLCDVPTPRFECIVQKPDAEMQRLLQHHLSATVMDSSREGGNLADLLCLTEAGMLASVLRSHPRMLCAALAVRHERKSKGQRRTTTALFTTLRALLDKLHGLQFRDCWPEVVLDLRVTRRPQGGIVCVTGQTQ